MMQSLKCMTRREFIAGIGSLGVATQFKQGAASAAPSSILTKPIPATGEKIPVVGMGTWITFNVGSNKVLRDSRVKVLQEFFDRGGGVIDSSPMYGSSEEVIGYGLARTDKRQSLFSATKVWTVSKWLGTRQMKSSERLWGVDRFDLMQIHNLLDWQAHLETLRAWKAEGRVRYIGITTSHGRRHAEFERVMRDHPFDTVQFTYNILDREVEKRLLPAAHDLGKAVIVNRPFRRGALFDRFARHTLPEWVNEIDCHNWAQFFLKFALSHPAVTCAIPATSRVDHMRENMGAAIGRMPNGEMRRRMVQYVENL